MYDTRAGTLAPVIVFRNSAEWDGGCWSAKVGNGAAEQQQHYGKGTLLRPQVHPGTAKVSHGTEHMHSTKHSATSSTFKSVLDSHFFLHVYTHTHTHKETECVRERDKDRERYLISSRTNCFGCSLRVLDLAGNQLEGLPSPLQWKTQILKELVVSLNKITKVSEDLLSTSCI